ncbi:hypothetical protein FB446DRAFT_709872 [Lentinula raphanica]|nr:hypothetical protein FB446DRAFT_709872 [Lentinula raphanica]
MHKRISGVTTFFFFRDCLVCYFFEPRWYPGDAPLTVITYASEVVSSELFGPTRSELLIDALLEEDEKARTRSQHAGTRRKAEATTRRDIRNQQTLPTTGTTWTGDQHQFEELIARLMASAGLPLSWVNNIEFDTLVREFIPGMKSISQKSLSHCILPTVIKQQNHPVSGDSRDTPQILSNLRVMIWGVSLESPETGSKYCFHITFESGGDTSSKTLILAHLAKAVICAVLTRWTAHYLAFVHLIELQEKLLELVYHDAAQPDEKKRIMKTGNAQAQRKAVEMILLIKNEAFWEVLSSIVTHLEPLAIAANVIQAAHCRLDQVLLMFGYLFYCYLTIKVNNTHGRDRAIISSIEARWKKCDQEVFIAAFDSIPAFNNAGIQDLCFEMQCLIPDPAQIFKGFTYPEMPGTQFIRLALHILGVSANSVSCEKLFSVFGNTLTKLRNCLRDTLQQSPNVLSNVGDSNSNMDQSETHNTSSFRSMMERNIAAVTDEEEEVASTGPGSVPLLLGTIHALQLRGGIPIQKLFNFSNQQWINLHLNRTKDVLMEELALYELLEAENNGDSNGLIDLDEMNEDLLSI